MPAEQGRAGGGAGDVTDPLAPAEVAALRTMMGLSQEHLAAMLGINTRTVRSWESGRDRASQASAGALYALLARHTDLVQDYLDADVIIGITRDTDRDTIPPRGWYLAAAGRALAIEPDLMVEWV